ncbi:MAG: hypothetical protein JWL73_2355 [Actinomycetia bacterium]|nr:hypothetical protein [Actinomycetes bacterium]
MTEFFVPKHIVPRITPDAAEFFAGTVREELRIQQCDTCGLHHHYPRMLCPHCGAETLHWVTASGRGVVHSYTVIRQNGVPPFNEQLPMIVALVDLEEPGARMLANLARIEPEAVEVDLEVTAVFRPASDEYSFVDFRPAVSA